MYNSTSEILDSHKIDSKSHTSPEQESGFSLKETVPPYFSRLRSIFLARLFRWNEWVGLGEVFDSSAAFRLPDGKVLSASASWIEKAAWQVSGKDEFSRIPEVVPSFIAEFISTKDESVQVAEKVKAWLRGGAKLVWVMSIDEERFFAFHHSGETRSLESFDQEVSGEEILPGFRFDLKELLS